MSKLNQVLVEAEVLLLKATLNPSLDTNLSIAFGDNYNVTIANNIFSSWRNNDFSNLPKIEVILATVMNGPQGAYNAFNNTIYLSSSLIESQSAQNIIEVLLEEYGHFIDAQINTLDTPGDEGEIWSNLVLNRKMNAEELDILRSENDWGKITVDGQIFNIEKSVITLKVNTTLDENDGSATIGSGLSLRDAIIIANENIDNEYIINLKSGQTYFLTLPSNDFDDYINSQDPFGGDLDITRGRRRGGKNVTIRTNGALPATINASLLEKHDRVFDNRARLNLQNLIVTGGKSGGVYNTFELTITQSAITNNLGRGIINNEGNATINQSTINNNGGGFSILGEGNTIINQSNISNNIADLGGGILIEEGYLSPFVVVSNSIISNNVANLGGGIYNNFETSLRIVNSTISENSANYGGGIYNGFYGFLRTINSTISGNSANYGGGIYNYDNGFVNTINSTISGNSANYYGGGIYNGFYSHGVTTINTTITNNIADADNNDVGDGGGIYSYNNLPFIVLTNTIVAGNFDTPSNAGDGTKHPDVSGTFEGNAHNLIGNLTGAHGTIGTGSDIVLQPGQTAGLGTLANNGGFTQTHALLSGSPAINAGGNKLISSDFADLDGDRNINERLPFDQRGHDYSRISEGRVDIGAFEFPVLPTLSINNVNIIEGNEGTKNAVFTISLTVTQFQSVNVSYNFATSDGIATYGSDYLPITLSSHSYASTMVEVGTIIIGSVSVVINSDAIFEPDETFFVNLTNVTGAIVTKAQGRGTIINDDGLSIQGDANNNNLVGSSGYDTLLGLGGNDTLQGLRGNDILDGGTDADRMVGGVGNDTYYVDNTLDRVIERVNEGTDTVISTITYSLPNHVENLILEGRGNINSTGNSLNNRITGNRGNNNLRGGSGKDTLIGGNGNDTLNGGTDADRMVGGVGNDTYYVDNTLDRVIERVNEGTDTVISTITYSLPNHVENLILEGTGNINGTGNSFNNRMTGNSGNNSLSGGSGKDTLIGGNGNDTLNGGTDADRMVGGVNNDTYYVDNILDRIIENSSRGIDTVRSTINYTLGNHVENLILEGTANRNGTGNGLNNSITGNSGNNILNGGNGNDSLIGGNGNDTLVGGAGNDTLTGGTEADFFRFNSPNEGIDRITDFKVIDDTLLISRSGFSGSLPLGVLSANRFRVGLSASTADQRFFYNSSNGSLFFDVDGNGATSAVRIATLNTGLAMTNADIVVI